MHQKVNIEIYCGEGKGYLSTSPWVRTIKYIQVSQKGMINNFFVNYLLSRLIADCFFFTKFDLIIK